MTLELSYSTITNGAGRELENRTRIIHEMEKKKKKNWYFEYTRY